MVFFCASDIWVPKWTKNLFSQKTSPENMNEATVNSLKDLSPSWHPKLSSSTWNKIVASMVRIVVLKCPPTLELWGLFRVVYNRKRSKLKRRIDPLISITNDVMRCHHMYGWSNDPFWGSQRRSLVLIIYSSPHGPLILCCAHTVTWQQQKHPSTPRGP